MLVVDAFKCYRGLSGKSSFFRKHFDLIFDSFSAVVGSKFLHFVLHVHSNLLLDFSIVHVEVVIESREVSKALILTRDTKNCLECISVVVWNDPKVVYVFFVTALEKLP